MPPKPFKLPRPSTTVRKTTAKPIDKARASTSSLARKKSSTTTTKQKSGTKPRTSGSRSSVTNLPSLSPDSSPQPSDGDPFSKAEEAEEEDDEEEVVNIEDGNEEQDEQDERRATIPPELLTRLLQEFFKEDGTRMNKEASAAVGRYMETFVREALARAAFAKVEGDDGAGLDVGGDGFLEVEDLEKLAPQLLLDF